MLNDLLKIVSSPHDRLVHYSYSDKMVDKLYGKQYIHPTGGHDLPQMVESSFT